jgi:hypothetical protein
MRIRQRCGQGSAGRLGSWFFALFSMPVYAELNEGCLHISRTKERRDCGNKENYSE